MNKLSKAFKAFGLILSKPYLLNIVLDHEDVKKKEIISKFGFENGLPLVDILDVLPDLDDTISPFSFLDGSSMITDFALLRGLAKKINCKSYFEIGTWRGESVAALAEIVENCTTLNLPDEELLKMNLSDDYVKMHRFFSKKYLNVTHLQANSLTFDFSPHYKKYDLVFVDGDHHTESIKSDTANAFKLLKDENSVIVWHDYAFSPETVRWNVLSGIMEGCPIEKRECIYHVSNTLCAVFTNSKLKTSVLKINQKPEKYFSVNIKAHKI